MTLEQILDINAFTVTQYNNSLLLEFEITSVEPVAEPVWLFVSFQHLPGPHPDDHDFHFLVDPSLYR
jgi:hypothetical protein